MQAVSRVSRFSARILAFELIVAAISGTSLGAAASPSPEAEKQIASGIALYKERCALCHSDNLAGGAGPPLRGGSFVSHWEGKPLRALYSRILMNMPANDPGSLTPAQVLTLVSYIASENALATWDKPFASANELSSITVGNAK